MVNQHVFDLVPLWLTFVCVIAGILGAIRIGAEIARRRKARGLHEDDAPLNTIVGATLGLLAFILAFSFGLTTNRLDARKQFQREEINSIETTWLRAGFIAEPDRDRIRSLLVDYVKLRVDLLSDSGKINASIAQANAIQRNLWSVTERIAHEPAYQNDIISLFISSMNDMFDNQSRRIATARDHIPGLIWIAFFTLIILSMFGVGYLMGRSTTINWYLAVALAIGFAAIILINIDLDSSFGTIHPDHTAIQDLYLRLQER